MNEQMSFRQETARQLDYDDAGDYASATPRRRSPLRYFSRSHYQDRDNESCRSPPRRRHSRSSSRSWSRSPRRHERARSPFRSMPPNRDLIMEGLPLAIHEKDIQSELGQYYQVEGLRDVKIIRDRKSGQSRGFGFLQFRDVQDATSFMDRCGGDIEIQGQEQRISRITLAYSRPREEREQPVEEDWICSNCTTSNYARRLECYKCQASKSLYNAGPPQVLRLRNTGDSDVSPDATPSQFLLFRGLEGSVNEDLLAKGAAKLYKTSEGQASQLSDKPKIVSTTATSNFGAQPGSIKRVFLVRDRLSNNSWKYGFAEFHTAEDAQAAYSKYNAVDKFTIASKQVMVNYVHAGVFIAADRQDPDHFSFIASSNRALRLSYWDQQAYLNEHMLNVESPAQINDGSVPSGTADSTANITGEGKSKKRKVEGANAPANKKSVPSHLQFWKDRHAELHGQQQKGAGDVTQKKESVAATDGGVDSTEATDAPPSRSFADPVKHCCYLCSRQFKTAAEVNKHERISQLHRDNLLKDDLRQKAIQKLSKAGVQNRASDSTSSRVDDRNTQEYRDRAKERRAVHGQPKKTPSSQNRPANSGKVKADAAAETAEEPSAKAASRGASLLGKMGWSAGQGLGAQGTGSVAPIAQDVYAAGVGLGAVGGKLGDAVEEAERRTKGDYASFLAKTRDTARDRWESMSKDA